jgi:hypothetical protein
VKAGAFVLRDRRLSRKQRDRARQNVRRVTNDTLMAMQPHRRDLPIDTRLSPKAITTLGQLNLQRRITDAQFEAGERYRTIVNSYRAVIGSIDPLCQPKPGRGVVLSEAEAERRTKAYNDAYIAVFSAGQDAAKWVRRVAIYDETCPISAFPSLTCGLFALAVHFGLTKR